MFNVLIVDDEQLARETIKYLLAQCTGVDKVYEADNGKSALQLANQYQPQIVLLDIEMPIINGITVAEQLPEETSIVFITAFNQFKDKMSARKYSDYLLKPFKDQEFYQCFEKACAIQRTLSQH
ncbi:LytR/AlgR family response regulator transcription factor [Paraglaciecola arctica]|uniref:LytR/AlgR family response regulator transcription factor n=1 Tax=Paraglaciecola arctica TaxID=1128911 RepID=UPI001C070AE0|nr:response regulator [Paraglaciecola arctica]MBU3004898.1 response regulator [Paraglaciecola arctica]